jgi:energy-coupling factor transport system ATP-binding protein
MDEPTSGLDWNNMYAVSRAVNYLRQNGKLVFIITHDLEFISLTATRALLMTNGEIKDDLEISDEEHFKRVRDHMIKESAV